jgi:predicted ATPase/DNA-binding XRE family transcriptional regulator
LTTLAQLVRSFRAISGLSQEMLAERAGLSTRAVSDIETGVARAPRLVTLMLLGEALGLSPADRVRLQEAGRKPAAGGASLGIASALSLRETALEGRESAVERVKALLSSNETRLVTLVGPAGVGKTSLAINVAIAGASEYEHGAALAELATIAEPSLVPAAVARALGICESGDVAARELVAAYLGERNFLLVLDNFEHLTPAAGWVAELLTASPRLTILATSREPLGLGAVERVFAVGPLRIDAATRLFVQRARVVKPDFEMTETNTAAVATIVERLDGLPLAIELAASRLLMLPPRTLAARLEPRLPLLGGGGIDRPLRQQSMRAAIAWSYDLLSEEEQRLFRNLAVLAGGGSLEAVAVLSGNDAARRSILVRLVEKNIITIESDSGDEPRVAMLEMFREFGKERLAQSGELEAARRVHAQYVLDLARHAASELAGAHAGRWLARYELEHRNIEAALEWAEDRREAEFGLHLIAAVWRFWWLRGHVVEGVEWISSFCALRNAAPAGADDVLHAAALSAKTVLLSALGNFNEALESCEEAIALQRAAGDAAGLADSLTSFGIVMRFRGERTRAETAHAESLEIRERLGDEGGMATSFSNLALLAQGAGDLARAAALAEGSAAICRRLGDRAGLAQALTTLGLVAAARRDSARAEELFTEALTLQRAVGDTRSLHHSLANLAAVAHRRGEHELALARYAQALDLLGAAPNKAALARLLEDLAVTTAAVGDARRAARLFGAGHTLRTAIGSPVLPAERTRYDAGVAALRATLGDDAFLVQWRIGLSMTLERALDEARRNLEVRTGRGDGDP